MINMNNCYLQTILVSGQLGIVDAALVRYLESQKKTPARMLIHVTGSIYNSIIPLFHLYEFLNELTAVHGIIKDKSQLAPILQQSGTTLIDLPQKELEQYSIKRILKKVDIENNENQQENKKATLDELLERYGANPYERKIKVGLVSGSFDLIHLGHIRYLKAAKELADVVIVATMSTNSIKQQEKNIKGDRPIYSQTDRVTVLSALRSVDYIVVFDQLDCKEVIRTLRPNCFIKHQRDMSRPIVKEECDLVEMSGGKVLVTNDDYQYSSTDIINHIRNIKAEEK